MTQLVSYVQLSSVCRV